MEHNKGDIRTQAPKIDVQDIKIEHKHVTDPKEIACIFNNYFTFKNIKGNKDETTGR